MFANDFKAYKTRILKYSGKYSEMTEEATKTALIMPFFTLLGYDVFDPEEIVPEYTCDVATKKGEKIDYAIMHDGEPLILIEAKRAGMKLQKQQQGQLYRYFSTNHARLAILTNGIVYNFFSDINAPNVMDDDPFLSFNLIDDEDELVISSLEQFHKDKFNLKEILSKAVFLKYIKVVEQTLRQDLIDPSDELVKYFLSRPEIKVGGRITAQIIEKHRAATAETMRKVMGITINVSSETKIPNSEPTDSVVDFIKRNIPGIECEQIKNDSVTTIFILNKSNKIGRLRYSKKKNSIRCDYTDLVSGKLYFIARYNDCIDLIQTDVQGNVQDVQGSVQG